MCCSHLQFVAKSLRRPCTPRGSSVTPQHCKEASIAVCAHASKHSTLHLEGNRTPLRVETPKAITQQDGNCCHGLVLSQRVTLIFRIFAIGPFPQHRKGKAKSGKERRGRPKLSAREGGMGASAA